MKWFFERETGRRLDGLKKKALFSAEHGLVIAARF
jgi:hypothetical protein